MRRKKAMNDDDEEGCWEFPSDVLVEIFQRLPTSSRRRFRLVCRLWRDLIDDHTTEMHSRAKPLLWNADDYVAYLIDDLSPSSTGSCTELWSQADDDGRSDISLVATCNGLLCLCNNEKMPGGAITLVNPATGEALPVPPLPCAGLTIPPLPCTDHVNRIHKYKWWVNYPWHQAYTFTYHPISGQYKVVHVPCRFDEHCKFDSVQVLTLGEASWREIPAGPESGARCDCGTNNIISVDGTAYWETVASVVSFDLEHERITALPTRMKEPHKYQYRLTEVHGKLGLVLSGRDIPIFEYEVWVLEKGRRWSHRYSVSCTLMLPHFVYGEYVLTQEGEVYANNTRKDQSVSRDVVRVSKQDQKTLIAQGKFGYNYFPNRTFAYVQTMEPLSIYATS